MANEITQQGSLQYQNPAIGVPLQQLSYLKTITIAGKNYQGSLFSVPTTAGGVVIPVSSLATLGEIIIVNRDPTNYITVLTGVAGTNIFRVLPLQGIGPFQFDPSITAPAWLAHTAACEAQYLALEL